jgi:hypothetical protein
MTEASSPPAARKTRPPRSRAERAERRRAKAELHSTIFRQLAAGLPLADFGTSLGLSPRRTRALVGSILRSRETYSPDGFLPLQVARLSDAMMVAHAKMMAGDLAALDRVLKITRELERYHGFRATAATLGGCDGTVARLAPPGRQRAPPAPQSDPTNDASPAPKAPMGAARV